MKNLRPIFVILLFGAVMLLTSSVDPDYNNYRAYEPYFMTRADLEKSVTYIDESREMKNPGKIYVHGSTIYVNERYKGVHVIDNSDPYKPVRKAFITVPGCLDMAVKGDIMYLDNAVDFVAFDLRTKEVTERFKSFFPPLNTAPDGGYASTPRGLIIVGWRER